ncbi:MAG: HAMP domain-containing histidine kinase [Bacteroidales bacterium]|nr:HAMP domain-containing histidine kinase [Bacteroidales bacterium]
MKKKWFLILIIMMLISIVGIICVQTIWIKRAVTIRNESFDRTVIECLKSAAESIERSRKANFINDYMFPNRDPYKNLQEEASSYMRMGSVSSINGNVSMSSTVISSRYGEAPVVIRKDTVFSSSDNRLIIPSPENPGEMQIVTPDQILTIEQNGVYLKQKEYLEWLEKRANEFLNMSDQMISEIYQWEKTMELDEREIEYALNRSFRYSGINTPFEFAVIKDGEVMGDKVRKAQKKDFLKSDYVVQLFADNIIRQDLNLSVVFPEKRNYVLGSMTWAMIGSLLFSLIIFATFAFSLYYIITQKKMSEMKSDFINNMTHEFKTPIATISLAADTITNPKVINDELRIRQFISLIKKENSRMNKKVETILTMASLDKQEIDFKFDNVSLHNIIEKAVDSISILVNQRGGTITLHLDAENPFIYGDPEHLYNLVNNLLDNAIKYSQDEPEITVQTLNDKQNIILKVSDKGIGMSKNVQNKIFERFYRQTSGNVHNVKGFGLGLNYVRSIVDAHKGTISVESELGKGSCFTVSLPQNEDINEKASPKKDK